MQQLPFIKRSLGVLVAMSAISLSTAIFLPDHHPINRLSASFADDDDVDEEVEEEVEEEIEDEIEDEIDEEIDEDLEDEIEDEIEEDLDDEIDVEIEEDLEDEFDEDLDDDLDEDIDDEIEEASEDELDVEFDEDWALELNTREDFEDIFRGELDDDDEDEFETDFEDDVEDEFEDEIEDEDEELDPDDEDDEQEEQDESEEDDDDREEEDDEDDEEDEEDDDELAEVPFDTYEFELDDDGDAYTANEFLILGSADEIDALLASGLVPEEVTALESLDLQLARVSTLGSQTREDVEDLIAEVAPSVELDVNHLYFEQAEPEPLDSDDPRTHLSFSESANATIGLIDTRLDKTHEALRGARVTERDFVRIDRKRPQDHGTAIASLMVGKSAQYCGFLPNAELFSASVFFETASGGSSATTDSLVAGLDWMLQSNVDVINMSLSGPPNAILRRAVQRVQAGGIVLVAAVGNDGPMASPRYPAAYDGVVGVTAVSDGKTAFRLAGRGPHVDFSAPGVDIRHAAERDSYVASSGTSFAAPYVTASFALALKDHDVTTVQDVLAVTAEDLGSTGFDPIYGHGLIRPPIIYHTAKAEDETDPD